MFARLKRKFLFNRIYEVLFVFLLITVALVAGIDDIKEFLAISTTGQVDLNSLSPDQIQENIYVKGEIRAVTGYYYGHEDRMTGDLVDMEYIIPLGDKYIGVYCEDSTMRLLETNMKMYQDARAGGADNPEEGISPVEVVGIIKPMEGESLEAYKEYAALSEFPANYLPYVLEERKNPYSSRTYTLVSIGICAVFLLGAGLYIAIRVVRGNMRTVNQYCRKRGNKEAVYRELEEFFYAERAICDILRLDDTFFMMVIKGDVFFAETKEILWIYSTEDANTFKALTVTSPHVIKIKMRDGSALTIGFQDVNLLNTLMRRIANRIPYVIIGYDRETEKLYKHNRQELIRMVERRRWSYLDAREKEINSRDMGNDGHRESTAAYEVNNV